MMTELKRCPFCGGKPYLESKHRAFIGGKTTKVSYVRCSVCNARSGRVELSKYGKTSFSVDANKEAIEAWNKRTPVNAHKD